MLSTADAMAATGMDPVLFRNMLARGDFTEAPPAGKGVVRYFDADDLVTLVIMKQMARFKMAPAFIARIGSEIRRTMRERPELETLWLVDDVDSQGRPIHMLIDWAPDDDNDVIFRFRLAVYREQAKADIARILRDRGE